MTKPSEPSDEGKAIEFERTIPRYFKDGRDYTFTCHLRWSDWDRLNGVATPADLVAALSANPEAMAACADGLSRHTGELRAQLAEARAELERVRAELELSSGDVAMLRGIVATYEAEAARSSLVSRSASPPSPPAAVEARVCDPACVLSHGHEPPCAVAVEAKPAEGSGVPVNPLTGWRKNPTPGTTDPDTEACHHRWIGRDGSCVDCDAPGIMASLDPAPAQEQPASPKPAGLLAAIRRAQTQVEGPAKAALVALGDELERGGRL
jgi:hypothetical protein